MCAPDIRAFVATLAPTGRPLPAGTTWPQLIDEVAAPATGDCAANRYADLLQADDRGDTSDSKYAGQQLASTYDAINALGGYGDDNWNPLRDAAAAGSRPLIERDYCANCESAK